MTKMLLARFALNQQALEGCQVAKLSFDYTNELDELLGFVLSQDSTRQQRKPFKWEWHEHPPYEQLNDVLTGSAPSLIHGFDMYGDTKKWPKSDLYEKPRYMLALTAVNGVPIWTPNIDQINDLVFTWANKWARKTFKVADMRGGIDRLEVMRKAIYAERTSWQPTNAAQLWKLYTDEEDTLVWSALSSVLAALFVHRMAGQVFSISDGEKTQDVTWQLTQEGNGQLAVVSEPFLHGKAGEAEGKGLAAYKLEFVMETVAGSTEPWIAVFVSRRRFADRRVIAKNYQRDVTILLSSAIDRKEGWAVTPTWVRFKVGGWLKKQKKDAEYPAIDEDQLRGIFWRSDTPPLWEEWKARSLPDPNDLLKTGGRPYVKDNEDRFLILHAEGMEYSSGSKHGAESGTSLLERKLLMDHVCEVMHDVLRPDKAIQVDEISTLAVDNIFENHLWALYTNEDLKTSTKAIPVQRGTGLSADEQRHFEQRRVTDSGLAVALGNKPLNLIIAAQEHPARQALEEYVRAALFLSAHEPFPACICVTHLPLPHDLNIAPGKDIPEQKTKEDRERAKSNFPAEWDTKSRAWKTVFQPAVDPSAHNIALVELNGNSNAITDKYTWRKTAARKGIYEAGASSQFVLSLPPKMAGDPTYFATAARSRVINAVRDAAVRQTGLLYGSLPQLYQYAGLDEERAKQLVIVALYRFRQSGSQKVDYPFAVEIQPDGQVMVVLPDEEGKPQQSIPYVAASRKMGKLFSRPMREHWRSVNYRADQNDTRLTHFASLMIGQSRQVPTLILMEADGWRQKYLKITANPTLTKDAVTLANKVYTPNDLPNTTLLRIRDAGTLNETPQFIAGEDPSWSNDELPIDSDGMLGAVDRRGQIMHFYSVARQSSTADEEQNNEDFVFGDGGDMAFRHQKIVEMLPWFAQSDDDRIIYSRIAHFLRFTPAWNRGNTVLSWPLHLAYTLAKNVGEVFIPNLK